MTKEELQTKLHELYDFDYTLIRNMRDWNKRHHEVLEFVNERQYFNTTTQPSLKLKNKTPMCECGHHVLTIEIKEKMAECEKCHKKTPYSYT